MIQVILSTEKLETVKIKVVQSESLLDNTKRLEKMSQKAKLFSEVN